MRPSSESLNRSQKLPVASHHAQRYADFNQQAIELLLKKPELLNLGNDVDLKVTQVRSTLMPKLVAQTPEGEVAIDIRAPDVNAARTTAAAAAALAPKITVLKLRFSKDVLVLHLKATRYADETISLLKNWANRPDALLWTVSFALLSPEGELQHKSS